MSFWPLQWAVILQQGYAVNLHYVVIELVHLSDRRIVLRYRTRAAIKKLLRTFSLFRIALFHKFLSRAFKIDLRISICRKWGLLWLLYLNAGKYWSDKKHSVFLTNITNLLNTLCKRIMYTYLLHILFFFI